MNELQLLQQQQQLRLQGTLQGTDSEPSPKEDLNIAHVAQYGKEFEYMNKFECIILTNKLKGRKIK